MKLAHWAGPWEEGKEAEAKWFAETEPVQKLHALFLLTTYWPTLSSMATASCPEAGRPGLHSGKQREELEVSVILPKLDFRGIQRETSLSWCKGRFVIVASTAEAEAKAGDVWPIQKTESWQ